MKGQRGRRVCGDDRGPGRPGQIQGDCVGSWSQRGGGDYEDGFPDLWDTILSGPALVRFGDGVHPVKLQYAFDPPLALPRPGKYAFFIQPECAFLYFDLLREA